MSGFLRRAPRPPAPLGVRLATTFFLVGEAAPVAPATAACLVLTPFLYPFLLAPLWFELLLTVLVTAVAIPLSTRAERLYGHDGGAIVIDEVAGMLVTFLALPHLETAGARFVVLGLGFFLFRFMDVLKPFPAGWAQRLPRGWGVVLDDVLAAVYANLVLRLLVNGS